jgi:H+/Cl- antiporter ClcA
VSPWWLLLVVPLCLLLGFVAAVAWFVYAWWPRSGGGGL